MLRKQAGVERVEWWGPAEDGTSLRLEASAGVGVGTRAGIPIGPVGALILVGRAPGPPLVEAVTRLVPLLRHRWTEERLATHSALLARRLQALDDFAAFVAHELKGPLHAALLADDPAPEIRKALHLVDSVLEAIRSESATDVWSSPGACLSDVLCDLDGIGAEVSATLPPVFPMPAAALRLVLRNLLANAAAAGAQWIRVSAGAAAAGWTLAVDDDGGDEAHDRYRSGSGIGLALCTRLVDRLGGELELRPRAHGGMRAQVTVTARVGSTAASAEQELREVSRPRPSSA
ncbi:MAG TPA: ATP-binding protein [Gaiellaceae bacterium]|nr:ATP-binding protein [Gaiellaceae bacterium]